MRIFLYNRPAFLGTWALAALLGVAALRWRALTPLALVGAGAVAWSLVALCVSFYVYDRSNLVGATWIPPEIRAVATWATIHAGLDAEVDADGVMQGNCVARLDIFDKQLMTSSSIERARRRTASEKAAIACSPSALALADGACGAVLVAFSAHEIRDVRARELFFLELRRVLLPGGKVLLVEHVRDVMNLLAFGPGFLHFQSRVEWLRLAEHADLRVAHEARITPWVMALALEKSA
jgi:SAM-dependent methyltransferase